MEIEIKRIQNKLVFRLNFRCANERLRKDQVALTSKPNSYTPNAILFDLYTCKRLNDQKRRINSFGRSHTEGIEKSRDQLLLVSMTNPS